MHKAGFVNIVGNPNVGKSTLMNALVGERISIATFKAQTTRHRIMGIYNTDDMQIVFSDTPGVLKPNYKLQESMLNFSTSALTDADVLLYVTDVVETPDKNNEFMGKVRQMTVPVLLLINKIDLTDQEKLIKLVEEWKELLPQAEIIPISAASKFNVDQNRGKDHSVFMGFAPMNDPKIAIAVYVENGGFGATYGVPIGAMMMDQYLHGKLSPENEIRAEEFSNRVILYGDEER